MLAKYINELIEEDPKLQKNFNYLNDDQYFPWEWTLEELFRTDNKEKLSDDQEFKKVFQVLKVYLRAFKIIR